MESKIQVVYDDASIIIDAPKTFISFDQRYASKGYPIPCDLFFRPTSAVIDMIDTSGFLKIDHDFTRYSQESGIYSILLIPSNEYSKEKIIQLFSNILIQFKLA